MSPAAPALSPALVLLRLRLAPSLAVRRCEGVLPGALCPRSLHSLLPTLPLRFELSLVPPSLASLLPSRGLAAAGAQAIEACESPPDVTEGADASREAARGEAVGMAGLAVEGAAAKYGAELGKS